MSAEPQTARGQRDPVARAIEILLWLGDHPADRWSVRSVARELGVSSSTVHRVFQTLERFDLLRRDGDGQYTVGLQLQRVSRAFVEQVPLRPMVHAVLEELAEQCGEAAVFGLYDSRRMEMMFLDVVQAQHSVRYMIEVDTWIPVHSGASGLAIMAWLSKEERDAIYARHPRGLTESTLTSRRDLETAIEKIRADGFACTHGQRTVGAVGLAAPVFDAFGAVFGDLCISIPEQRYHEDKREWLGSMLMDAAERLNEQFRRAAIRRT